MGSEEGAEPSQTTGKKPGILFYILLSYRILFGYKATAYRIKCFLTCTLQKILTFFSKFSQNY
jgi:hypothetical protein